MNRQTQAYLLLGDEYLVAEAAKELVRSFVPPDQEALGLEVIDASAETAADTAAILTRCIEALQTVGFMDGQKVVWLRGVSFPASGAEGEKETLKARIDQLTGIVKKGLLPGQVLVISSGGIDKRSSFYRVLKDAAEVREFVRPEKSYQAERYAEAQLREALDQAGLKMNADAMNAFLEKVGTDTRQIAAEVEKLAVYKGKGVAIGIEDINAVVSQSRELEAWSLGDPIGRRDLPAALQVLEQLLFQGVHPIRIIAQIERTIRDLLIFREALDRGWVRLRGGGRSEQCEWNVPTEIGEGFSLYYPKGSPLTMHPFRGFNLGKQAEGFSRHELERCLSLALAAHEQLVSISAPPQLVLEVLLMKMLAIPIRPQQSNRPVPAPT